MIFVQAEINIYILKQNYDQFIQSCTDFVHKFYTPTRKQSLGLHEEEHFHQSVTYGSQGQVQLQTQQSTQEKSMRLANVSLQPAKVWI